MKPFVVTIVNSITLVVMGLWGYFSSEDPSATAFIPVIAGVILLILSAGIRNGNRIIAHSAVMLTLVLLIALIKPLSGSIARNDTTALIRVVIMMITCMVAIIFYVKSFIDARRQRA